MSQPFGAAAEQRDLTSGERRKMTRTFFLILLLFLGGVGAMVAVMSVQGRAAREYGQMVLAAARARTDGPSRTCAELLPGKPVPPNVESCAVERQSGQTVVVLRVEGDRQYVVR